jgi:hypothetical protein
MDLSDYTALPADNWSCAKTLQGAQVTLPVVAIYTPKTTSGPPVALLSTGEAISMDATTDYSFLRRG